MQELKDGKCTTYKNVDALLEDLNRPSTLREKLYNALIYPIEQIPTKFKELGRSIKNVAIWFPLLWKDRHWDYVYILIILKKKLELTLKQLEWDFEHTILPTEEELQSLEDLRYCIKCCDKLVDERNDFNGEEKDSVMSCLCSTMSKSYNLWWS